MKKILKTKIIYGIFLCLATTFSYAAPVARDNYVCFYDATITSFKLTDHVITTGQPFLKDVTIESQGTDSCLYIYAGRKNDEKNVEWVKNNMALAGVPWDAKHMVTTSSSNRDEVTPSKLHFAIKGNLSLYLTGVSYICNDIQMGQGKFGLENNWWIFSNNSGVKEDDYWSIKCQIANTTTTVLLYVDRYNSYNYNLFMFKGVKFI